MGSMDWFTTGALVTVIDVGSPVCGWSGEVVQACPYWIEIRFGRWCGLVYPWQLLPYGSLN